jgi:hypothetical protein
MSPRDNGSSAEEPPAHGFGIAPRYFLETRASPATAAEIIGIDDGSMRRES